MQNYVDLMNRRDFLTLRTKGRRSVLELSCERLFMRYSDARSGAGRRGVSASQPGSSPQSSDGEPTTEMETPTVADLFDDLDRQLSRADTLRVRDRQWLSQEDFGREVEARIEAFQRRGGVVEFADSAPTENARRGETDRLGTTIRSRASKLGLAVFVLAALGVAACSDPSPQNPPDEVLKERVEAALERASDLPENAITVTVRDGVVTLTGSIACQECGGSDTPPGFGTVQQSLGAVVRAIRGVERVEFELEYGP